MLVIQASLSICQTREEQSTLRALLLSRGLIQLLDGVPLEVDFCVRLVQLLEISIWTKLGLRSAPDLKQGLGKMDDS